MKKEKENENENEEYYVLLFVSFVENVKLALELFGAVVVVVVVIHSVSFICRKSEKEI